MTDATEYGPSTWGWVADQVEEYEASGGQRANTLMDTGLPIIVMTTVGHKTGLVRKVPLMRVQHDGEYAIIASKAGMPHHPGWYHNLVADPNVRIHDGPEAIPFEVREVSGDERGPWYARAVEAYPPYADYELSAAEHDRVIPVFVAAPASD
jgi:deazaflavin-dependent oxidoreductase (nitroreductase family)